MSHYKTLRYILDFTTETKQDYNLLLKKLLISKVNFSNNFLCNSGFKFAGDQRDHRGALYTIFMLVKYKVSSRGRTVSNNRVELSQTQAETLKKKNSANSDKTCSSSNDHWGRQMWSQSHKISN